MRVGQGIVKAGAVSGGRGNGNWQLPEILTSFRTEIQVVLPGGSVLFFDGLNVQ
jgi:hypothetical protein